MPGLEFCIDKSLVLFQGRLIKEKYIPQKAHKYNIKLLKLSEIVSNGT